MGNILKLIKVKRDKIFIYLCFFMISLALLAAYFFYFQGVLILDDEIPLNKKFKLINKIGNANYYNIEDGKYYEDAGFITEANDNTGYLLKLFNSEGSIKIPEGNFLCCTKIVLKGKDIEVTGVKGATKIIIYSGEFVNYGRGSFAESIVVNKNNNGIYNLDTAQNIKIENNQSYYFKRGGKNNEKMSKVWNHTQ